MKEKIKKLIEEHTNLKTSEIEELANKILEACIISDDDIGGVKVCEGFEELYREGLTDGFYWGIDTYRTLVSTNQDLD